MSDLRKNLDEMMDLFNSIKREVRQRDEYLYERWKAGGFLVDSDILSMYPAIEQVVDSCDYDEESEDDEVDEDDE